MQERYGSRSTYARMEQQTRFDGLTNNEVKFIANRDRFYIASIGENGFPYIQHGTRHGRNGISMNFLWPTASLNTLP